MANENISTPISMALETEEAPNVIDEADEIECRNDGESHFESVSCQTEISARIYDQWNIHFKNVKRENAMLKEQIRADHIYA